MALTICIYEDEANRHFFPLTLLRPVYTLRAGIIPLFQRSERFFDADSVSLVARNQVAPLLAETFREYPVNIIRHGETDVLFLNGRIRDYGDLAELIGRSRLPTVFTNHHEVVAVLFQAELLKAIPDITTQTEFQQLFEKEQASFVNVRTAATLYNYCWDLVADIESEITVDFEHLKPSFPLPRNLKVHEGVFLVNEESVFLGDGVGLFPGVVLDASKGPVYIGDNVKIEPHAAVVGPAYIGPNSVVLAGTISGSSVGHTCRVGGEVEASIFHAYVNKYHTGFIGHSYVGQWVNFGAMTTNSDLKNNYSSIRLTLNGETIDSGSIKVGSFVGDHAKFGIGTLLNTGINIGVCCNIFGGTLVSDREVPSFSWGSSAGWEKYEYEKALETAQKAAQRRNYTLSDREVALLEVVFKERLTDDGVMSFSSR